jgi:hypothetical protein
MSAAMITSLVISTSDSLDESERLRTLKQFSAICSSMKLDKTLLVGNMKDNGLQQYSGEDARKFQVSLRYSYIRTAFKTEKGYVGIGPAVMNEHDIVCILFGEESPFILRPMDDHYLLFGDCFILGIMIGEAMGEFNKGMP